MMAISASTIGFILLLLGRTMSIPSCASESNTSFMVDFDTSELPIICDLFYVQLAIPDHEDKPYSLITTEYFPITISGLNPGTTYSLSIRGHNSSTPSISWGPSWISPTDWIQCTTLSSSIQQPKIIERESSLVHPLLDPFTESTPSSSLSAATTTITMSNYSDLAEGANDSRFLRVYRISEYSFDVDFLANHDAASIGAMPLYLMTCSPGGICAPWSVNDTTNQWASCQETLSQLCRNQRGAAFDCMSCMDTYRDEVTESCGEWSDQDTTVGEGSYSVHWYCGVGWPESTAAEGPITEYCVEYLPLDQNNEIKDNGDDVDNNGFSDYLSCNSDEVDAFGNDPRNPSCICICYDDRLLSHQSIIELQRDCRILTDHDDVMPWVNETSCNCPNTNSPLPDASSSMLTHIGRTPIFIPYVGIPLTPGPRPFSQLIGNNYHFPIKGECKSNETLGENGCTWRRNTYSRMIYGEDLINAGWDLSFVPDTPNDTNHTQQNIDAFANAFKALDRFMLQPGCGDS